MPKKSKYSHKSQSIKPRLMPPNETSYISISCDEKNKPMSNMHLEASKLKATC